MLVVLDTNVFLSAFLSPRGTPAEILRRWEAEAFEVATSPTLRAELSRTLDYSKITKYLKASDAEIQNTLRRLALAPLNREPTVQLDVVKRDRDDNRVLECAVEVGAEYIVTGDEDLLELQEYDGIQILSPAEFVRLLDAQADEE
ncbi:MAG: putative toxin-antitoxin system toxin component, PIN family [Chloroflexi bacterium]|nr:putative toxin-antitoxin system toxin component, PIN family [Chloroflexota bacterium]